MFAVRTRASTVHVYLIDNNALAKGSLVHTCVWYTLLAIKKNLQTHVCGYTSSFYPPSLLSPFLSLYWPFLVCLGPFGTKRKEEEEETRPKQLWLGGSQKGSLSAVARYVQQTPDKRDANSVFK